MTTYGLFGVYAISGYFICLLLIGWYAKKHASQATLAEHFLADRSLTTPILFLTLYATGYSGNNFLSYAAEAYHRGYAWIVSVGFMVSVVLSYHFIAPRLRPLAKQFSFITPGDWLAHRFAHERGGRLLRRSIALLMLVVMANYLLTQLKVIGEVTEIMTQGLISYEYAVVVMGGMILIYETLGGMRAVVWTDVAQSVIMFIGLMVLFLWLVAHFDGLASITQQIAVVRPEAVAIPTPETLRYWVSTLLLGMFAAMVYPQLIQRIYAAKSAQALKRSLMLSGFMPFVTTLIIVLVGIGAIVFLAEQPNLSGDQVLPALLHKWAERSTFTLIAATLVLLGIVAAIMSTADSVLLSSGSLITRDLLQLSTQEERSVRISKRVMMGVMLVILIAARYRSLSLWQLIELKLTLLIQCMPAIVLPLFFVKLRAPQLLFGLVAGVSVLFVTGWLGLSHWHGLQSGLLAWLANLGIVLLGTVFQSQRLPPRF